MKKKNIKVHKHNDLIQARYGAMSLHEQMLLLACIGKVDPRELKPDTPVELTVPAFADLADIQGVGAYDDLRRAARRLYNRSVIIDNPDPEDPDLEQTETRWVASINYYHSKGRIKLYFAPKIIPYLANLKANYTAFFLRHVSQFRSVYGVRLYELLVQWQSKGEREVTVDWLREHWGLEDKYSAVYNLKRKVIEPAMRDINTYSNLWVKMGQRKVGRQVVAFQFRYGLKSTAEVRVKLKEGETAIPKRLTRRYVEQHAKPGESYDAAYTRLRRKRDEQRRAATPEEEQTPSKHKRRRGKRNDEELDKMRGQLGLKLDNDDK